MMVSFTHSYICVSKTNHHFDMYRSIHNVLRGGYWCYNMGALLYLKQTMHITTHPSTDVCVNEKGQSRHAFEWRHNGRDSVSNHQPHDCLLNRLFRRRSKKTSQLRVTGLFAGAQMASNAFDDVIMQRRDLAPFVLQRSDMDQDHHDHDITVTSLRR